jgi:large subunit ribosomal protein L1
MAKRGKKYLKALEQVETREYELNEAIDLIKRIAYARFDESLELAMRLGVNPKHADQMVRGTVVLPNGLGKKVRVVVVTSAEKAQEAKDAGADEVGGEDLVDKIAKGYLDFDAVIATPDMMKFVGKLGRILGPRGLMPNPKTGTVTFDVGKAVTEIKAGRVEFRVDKTGIIHAPVGKLSFENGKLEENASALIDAVAKARPATSKGKYIRSVFAASSMGPGVMIALNSIDKTARK